MKQEEFCRQLEAVTPEIPDHFYKRVGQTLESIISQNANELTEKPKAYSFMGYSISRSAFVLIVALMLMLMSLTAYALSQWKIFEYLSDIVGDNVPVQVQELVQSNIHQQTVNNVQITIQEACYDGRTLLLQYSYRFLDMDEILGVTADEFYQGNVPAKYTPDSIVSLKYDAIELMAQYGVTWWTDELWINGESIMMPSDSGAIDVGSSIPGEIIHTEYWRLDNAKVQLDGIVEITLPIGSKENGGFTFSFDTHDIQKQVETVKSEYRVSFDSFTAVVKEATFTPLMTYITLGYEDNNATQRYTEDGQWWPFATDNQCFAWIYSLQLVDRHGVPIFSTDYNGISVSETEAQFYLPATPENHAELWLAPVHNGQSDMSQAIKIR